jgi:predicted ATPase
MITRIEIDGFKSFQDFEMEFTPFTIIAGTNASGKSNLFDAIRLLSALAEQNLRSAFNSLDRGELNEFFTRYGDDWYADKMRFSVEMLVNRNVQDAWGSSEQLKYTRLRYELIIKRIVNQNGIEDLEVEYEKLDTIKHKTDEWVKRIPSAVRDTWRPKVESRRGIFYMDTVEENGIPTVIVPQDGKQGKKRFFPLIRASKTVLSSFETVDFPHILAAKEEMRSWRSLQLNPDELRKPTSKKTGEDVISSSGSNLAAALFRIKQLDNYSLVEISRKLNSFLPTFTDVNVLDDRENNQFVIEVTGDDGRKFSSRVLSEGTLRFLALCIFEQDDLHTGLLCFEEPENGIHPFRIKAMLQLLKDLSVDLEENVDDNVLPLRQVIVNTHSPAIVGAAVQWEEDNNVSVHYAQLRTLIAGKERSGVSEKVKLFKTMIVQVENRSQSTMAFSEKDRSLTVSTVMEYLKSTDVERGIDVLRAA